MAAEVFAVVEDGIVTNTVMWDPTAQPAWKPLRGAVVPVVPHVQKGDLYTGGQFTLSNPPPAKLVPDLEKLKAREIGKIEAQYRLVTTGPRATPEQIDAAKTTALLEIAAIERVKTVEELVGGTK